MNKRKRDAPSHVRRQALDIHSNLKGQMETLKINGDNNKPALEEALETALTVVDSSNQGPVVNALAFIASQLGSLSLFKLLIESKRVPQLVKNHKRCNLLHAAAGSDQHEIIDYILTSFEYENVRLLFLATSNRGRTPVEILIAGGSFDSVYRIFGDIAPYSQMTYPLLQNLFTMPDTAGFAKSLYKRVLKSQVPDRVKQVMLQRMRYDELHWFQMSHLLGRDSVAKIEESVKKLCWWPDRAPYSLLENVLNYAGMCLSMCYPNAEKVRWLIEVAHFPMEPPDSYSSDALSLSDYAIFNRLKGFERAFNVYEGSVVVGGFSRKEQSLLFHKWVASQSLKDLDLLVMIANERGKSDYTFRSGCPWSQLLLHQDEMEAKLEVMRTLISLDKTPTKKWSLPRLDLLVLSNSAIVLKGLVHDGHFNLNEPYVVSDVIVKDENIDLESERALAEYNPSDDCPICLCPIQRRTKLDCSHVFCRSCILFLKEKAADNFKCPLCRRDISHISKVLEDYLLDIAPWLTPEKTLSKAQALLGLAAACGAVHVLKWLIEEFGVDPKATIFIGGNNLMHVAVAQGGMISIMWLLQNGFQDLAKATNNDGLTPIHLNLRTDHPHSEDIQIEFEKDFWSEAFAFVENLKPWAKQRRLSFLSEYRISVLPVYIQEKRSDDFIIQILSNADRHDLKYMESSGIQTCVQGLIENDRIEVFKWLYMHLGCMISVCDWCIQFRKKVHIHPDSKISKFHHRIMSAKRLSLKAKDILHQMEESIMVGGQLSDVLKLFSERQKVLEELCSKYADFDDLVEAPKELHDEVLSDRYTLLEFAVTVRNYAFAKELLTAEYFEGTNLFDGFLCTCLESLRDDVDVIFCTWFLDFVKSRNLSLDQVVVKHSGTEPNMLFFVVNSHHSLFCEGECKLEQKQRRSKLLLLAKEIISRGILNTTRDEHGNSALATYCRSTYSKYDVDDQAEVLEMFKVLFDFVRPSLAELNTILEKICKSGSAFLLVIEYLAFEKNVDIQHFRWGERFAVDREVEGRYMFERMQDRQTLLQENQTLHP
ncbi:hypothetical protein BCR33DRAFT_722097 [Rhizoclosmatium globosum]|uniref:RING-type domain-containing protein n=1 Tax=Rhizoclosmatium globosum TaxID=329046 RepID=A0A1Y2BNK2_9FUNG|nr:hypothetical protein BCR33DRAFT_722097 [Rhizoclosmatium globosum]|eukprot:ORY36292.1 hypothetical protein BCR33DRAFT_722097 [Rhizoclosmatium globosum]